MKKILLIVLVILLPGRHYAQLIDPFITSAPSCLLGPGTGGTVTCTPIPGATGYEWKSNLGPSQSIWFPSAPGPIITAVPYVNILCNLGQQSFEICVRAVNAVDSSSWVCIQILGILVNPVLAPGNSQVGLPGDSGYYSIVNPIPCSSQLTWFITGDATFNNGSQSITINNIFDLGVNINFGPNFTSGTLCVVALSQTGLTSDTVCMVITAPVGINEPLINFSFVSGHDKVILEFTSVISEKISVRQFDISGKCLSNEIANIKNDLNQLEFSTAQLSPGIYFLELTGKSIHKQFRFVKTE